MTDKKANPLESIFDIEPGSTPIFHDIHTDIANTVNERASMLVDPTNGELIERLSSGDIDIEKEERIEDLHIDGQLETVHTAAIIAFEKSSRFADEADPKFAARNAEVAAQYLNIALNAVNSRIDAKAKRIKSRIDKVQGTKPGTVNNNIIISDRNELLRQILGQKEPIEMEQS